MSEDVKVLLTQRQVQSQGDAVAVQPGHGSWAALPEAECSQQCCCDWNGVAGQSVAVVVCSRAFTHLPACCWECVLLWQSCLFQPRSSCLSQQGSGALSARLVWANGACNSLIRWEPSEIDDLCMLLVVAQPWPTACTSMADNGKWVPCTRAWVPVPISMLR